MRVYTNKFVKVDDKKHSKIFKPVGDEDSRIASSIYIMNGVIPIAATECKITISWPEGGQDEAYLKV